MCSSCAHFVTCELWLWPVQVQKIKDKDQLAQEIRVDTNRQTWLFCITFPSNIVAGKNCLLCCVRIDEEASRRRSTCDITDSAAIAGSLAADFNKIAGVRNSGSFRRRSLFRRHRHRRSDQRDSVGGGNGAAGTGQMRPSHSEASINSGGSVVTTDGKLCIYSVGQKKPIQTIWWPVFELRQRSSEMRANRCLAQLRQDTLNRSISQLLKRLMMVIKARQVPILNFVWTYLTPFWHYNCCEVINSPKQSGFLAHPELWLLLIQR